MDYQTKNEIQNQVEKMFSQFKADEKNKKIMEKIIGGLQKIANEKHDEALFRGYVVKQAVMAIRTLDSDKVTKADLQDELSMLINVCMAAPGVTIEYYTPENEGLRIGTVRRPPRGVKKSKYASQNWYDVWLPNVAPTSELMNLGQSAESDKKWSIFVKKYRAETSVPEKNRILDLIAALSHNTNFSVGCYCENEARFHRSILRELLVEKGAKFE